jgi:2-keto-4-pentenoate hydratase/2-oxohepta-3-ene-1,7-dioic acid hydratase in catechol pathway
VVPLGPALVTPSGLKKSPNDLAIRTRVNGEVMQQSNTCDMIFPVDQIIEFLSGSTTLEPGTLILTGTPAGVGMGRKPPVYLKPGDVVEVEIEGIGILHNPVIEEEPARD